MPSTLTADVVAQAQQAPDAPALWYGAADGPTVSYAELVDRANRIGEELAHRYPDAGRPLALQSTKSPTAIAVILACMTAGRPLLLASPDLGRDLLAELMRRSGCASLLAVADGELTHQPAPSSNAAGDAVPQGTSLLLTTSGSTGIPKLVPLPGAAVEAFTAWAGSAFELGGGTRVLNFAPLNFDLCLLDVWATLRSGGCVVPVDPDRCVDPKYLVGLLEEARPRVVQAVPMFFRLLTEAADGAFPGVVFPSVRDVLLTGDHVPRSVRAALPRLFPRARLHNVYGCTETNDSMLRTFTAAEAVELDVVPLGSPLPGVAIDVLAREPGPDGANTGELLVSTPFQTTGYVDDDGLGDRFETRDGRTWYRTGDLVTRNPAGELVLVGRADSQVKVRGVRVNLEEIERVLQGHEHVAEAAVVAVPDPDAGHVLHAFVRRTEHPVTGLQLRSHCAARIVRAAIPTAFHLVADPLPVGPTGKVNRRRLLEGLT